MAKKVDRRRLKQPPGAEWREGLSWQIAGLMLLVMVAYGNSLAGSFQFDDQTMLYDPYVAAPGFGWEIFRLMQTRPLTYLTFHWNCLAGAGAPYGWHLVNLLLHAGNIILLLLFARRHLSPRMALVAAALFAVHPLQTEAVDYIYQRATLLATLFALLSFWLFVREQYTWSVGAFGLSLLAKEETIALPALLILYDLVYRRRRPRVGYYAAMLGLTILAAARLFYVLDHVRGPTVGFRLKGIPAFAYALTEARVVWKYLQLYVLPVGLNVDHDVALSQGLLSPPSTLPALFGLAVLLGLLTYFIWKGKQPAFWGLGFFILLAPSSSFVPFEDVMFEHRTYFPLACLVIASAGLLAYLPRRVLLPAVGALVMALLVTTIARNRVWRDGVSLWTDVLTKSPHRARAYLDLASVLMPKDPQRSRELFERGLELDPNHVQGHLYLGVVLAQLGDPKGALTHFQRAMALGGETSGLWNNMGSACLRLHENDQAVTCFRRSLALDTCNDVARFNLASLLGSEGRKEEAFQAAEIPTNCPPTSYWVQKLAALRRSLR